MFIYCFDESEKMKLQESLRLFKKDVVDGKQCWIFIISKGSKFNFDSIDKSKCIVSNKMTF